MQSVKLLGWSFLPAEEEKSELLEFVGESQEMEGWI